MQARRSRRNFLLDVLLPSLFMRRGGVRLSPTFPTLSEGQVCLTWVGHASFLIQTPRHNVLIDPNWANWMLVIRRLKRAGFAIRDLPNIDLVLITHAHFDHLNRRSLREIAARQPVIVPSGVSGLVRDLGFEQIREMAWWDRWDFQGLSITFTPAHHWGARYLADRNRGYGGYSLAYGSRTIYHCGDTAYFREFPEIGKRLQPQIVLMPIGSYDQVSRRVSHITPEKAVQAFLDVHGKILIPMHFGTYRMSYEPLHEPAHRLLVAARRAGILSQVHFLHEGVPRVF
ncbi:MAG: MBL fold metallo-hydrolase [Candidatus Methylacidiphilaceae bacterium]